jgi:cation/acetate symporter
MSRPKKALLAMTNADREFSRQLHKVYAWYTLGVLIFIALLAWLESRGLRREWIGASFLLATIAVYATIGIFCRTTDTNEYYVAGRRIPAMYNGMAIAADWMSAASFVGLVGTLYLGGYSGFAFIVGWTGGFCLVALLIAPYLRQFGQYTIADFFAARYGGRTPRVMSAVAAIMCSFVYLVAQIYAIGLISSRLTGIAFEIGIFLGLGGVLLCSFLGGMRAVTWTQVAQYILMIIAFTVPVVWLSVKQTGSPVPHISYGQQLDKITQREEVLLFDAGELQVRDFYAQRVAQLNDKLAQPAQALALDRQNAARKIADLKAANAPVRDIAAAERALAQLPRDEKKAIVLWQQARSAADIKAKPLSGMPRHTQPYAGNAQGTTAEKETFNTARNNFLALIFCLMVGTAGLPHVLTRYYTTSSVRQARSAASWSLFFILIMYLAIPALAVLVKYEIFQNLVGLPFDKLPVWIAQWSRVDASLVSVVDVNLDGVLQLGEITLSSDVIMLAMPEIAGLPYVIAALVAAGGLAAALSTADGLLLTMASALSHDLYYKIIAPQANAISRVTMSKVLLLIVALVAAYAAAQKPGDIVFMVTAAFSLAASIFFPALVAGIFWRGATGWGAIAGMWAGLGVTAYYMVVNHPWLRSVFAIDAPVMLWWGIQPLAAGVFGVPTGAAVLVAVSLMTYNSRADTNTLVNAMRYGTTSPETVVTAQNQKNSS